MTLPPAPVPKHRSISQPERTPFRQLGRSELPSETLALARALIGAVLVSDSEDGRTAIRIVETEAYLPEDAAAHSFRGRTTRNASLFLPAGHAYVYFIYGMYFCMNVSSEAGGIGAGVLLRAGEPLAGLELMRERRPRSTLRDICRGPGRLAAALGIGREHDGLDLLAPGPLWLAAGRVPASALARSRRIGITKEADRLLRFFDSDSPSTSGTRRENAPNAGAHKSDT